MTLSGSSRLETFNAPAKEVASVRSGLDLAAYIREMDSTTSEASSAIEVLVAQVSNPYGNRSPLDEDLPTPPVPPLPPPHQRRGMFDDDLPTPPVPDISGMFNDVTREDFRKRWQNESSSAPSEGDLAFFDALSVVSDPEQIILRMMRGGYTSALLPLDPDTTPFNIDQKLVVASRKSKKMYSLLGVDQRRRMVGTYRALGRMLEEAGQGKGDVKGVTDREKMVGIFRQVLWSQGGLSLTGKISRQLTVLADEFEKIK